MALAWLDRVLYRHPFEGASARRYATAERPAFGDLDDRLLDAVGLDGARRLLDVGSGPGMFAARARARFPGVHVVELEPSHAYTPTLRAAGEAIPLRDGCVDVAICLSSIRHVRDRSAVLREIRRVARRLWIVELDPHASARRIANHADHIHGALLRHAFGPLVVKTAPAAEVIIELAREAGWRVDVRRDDAVQPVYILELS
ncbi:MAG: class I SAM-dependent methyltransferase [Deltaproteobacteria bacterium]|nr:class I SAM-dependent methyltransferase [Deltaproteobacteria bacterium]